MVVINPPLPSGGALLCFATKSLFFLVGRQTGLSPIGNVCFICLLRVLPVVFIVGFLFCFLRGINNADDPGTLVAWFLSWPVPQDLAAHPTFPL